MFTVVQSWKVGIAVNGHPRGPRVYAARYVHDPLCHGGLFAQVVFDQQLECVGRGAHIHHGRSP